MRLKQLRFLIIIILLNSSLLPLVSAAEILVSPDDSEDDAFITGTGNYFGDTPFIFLRDQTTFIVAGTRFKDVNIVQGEKINNATLYVRSVYDYPASGEILVTITGDDIDDSAAFNDSASFTRTYTHEFVRWDISGVIGNQWNTVEVTEIVQEIIDRPGWTSGNSLSLVFFCDQGIPRREFASVDNFYAPAYINITYGVAPPADVVDDISDGADPPYNDTDEYVWEYNETYRGIDIFIVSQVGDPELLVTSSSSLNYMNSSKGDVFTDWASSGFSFQSGGAVEFIASQGDWIYLVGKNNSNLQVFYSNDEFQTWQVETPNNNYAPLTGHGSEFGSIWADQNGSNVMHLVYSSFSDWNNAVYDIIYTNFTLDPVTETLTWAPTFENVTVNVATSQTDPDAYQEQDGTIHIVWSGLNGTVNEAVQYRRKQANGTWLDALRLSGTDAFDHQEPDIVANEVTGVALAAWTRPDAGNDDVKWETVFPNNTQGIPVGTADRQISDARYVSMVNDRNTSTAHITYQEDSNLQIEYRYKTIDNTTAWSAEQDVSPAGEQHHYPVIGLDEDNNTLAIVWWNQWNVRTAYEVFQIASGPIQGKENLNTHQFRYPSMPDYFSRQIIDTFIFLVFPNGTLVDTSPLDEGDDPYDEIDDLLGGAQPEDPEEDIYTIISKFRWKLLVLAIGMIMMLGAPIAGVFYGADIATWWKILYIMFFGLGILWQIKFM